MSVSTSPSSGKPHGTARVCRLVFILVSWHVSRATLYRHRQPPAPELARRRGPAGPMLDADLPDIGPLWRSALSWRRAPSMAKGIARSGHDCACVAYGPPCVGYCA